MADSEYQKRQEGDVTVFEVTPATSPKSWAAAFFGVIFFLVGLCMIGTSTTAMFIFLGLGGLVIYRGWFRDSRPIGWRSNATIRVTPSVIETDGRTFNKEDISRLIIKTCERKTGNVYYLQQIHLGAIPEAAKAVVLETGGKAYTLAGGMDETTAYGLLKDVGKIIGLTHEI
ncbi:MAG: hypothetical protein WBQ86_21760 [Candidatus Binatus sp.]